MEENNIPTISSSANQIEDLCTELARSRKMVGLSVLEMEKMGLNHVILKKIENGSESFTMKSIFKYAECLQSRGDFKLALLDSEIILGNHQGWGQTVDSLKDFGAFLKEYRYWKHVSLADMLVKAGLQNGQIIGIERGKNCTGKTIQRYFSVFPDLYLDIVLI